MLNKDDVEQLDKLLGLVKNSSEYDSVDISYSKEGGWRVNVYPYSLVVGEYYGDHAYKKERLGKLCLDRIAWLVQKKLGG